MLVHESSEQMVGSVCMGAYRLVYQSPKDLLMAERWRDMLLCPLYTRSLAKTRRVIDSRVGRDGLPALPYLCLIHPIDL